jgi:hypothetical protein
MPVKICEENNKPGWKWGDEGKCYTYDPRSEIGSNNAKKKAIVQGIAIGEYFNNTDKRGDVEDIKNT